MKRLLFLSSYIFTILVCIFMLTKLSLNGYITDFYFFVISLLLNLLAFWVFSRISWTKSIGIINLAFASWQIIALCIFLCVSTLQVDKVYTPANNKHNLYSALLGWHNRAYFRPYKDDDLCDGVFWQTKVPCYFPLIEIETSRDKCYNIDNIPNYDWLFKHVPE